MDNAFDTALKWSQYLHHRVQFNPHLQEQIIQDAQNSITSLTIQQWFDEENATYRSDDPIEQHKITLRLLRQRVFSALILRDIAQQASFEEVTQAMSALADFAIKIAYHDVYQSLCEVHGTPVHANGSPMNLIILGMGKLGGQELNVSSDIDLITLYADEGETTGRRPISYHEFFSRLTQRMMPILSEQTAQGFVFRTDLRLRPDGDSGPLAWSLEALENYLILQGREWERYAWLKARVIPLGVDQSEDLNYLESIRRPFVYRKYLDFNTLSSLRQLHDMIREDWSKKVNKRNFVENDDNIKLGDGGIREVEFIVQVQQLIRGGRIPDLRVSNLLTALDKECEYGIIEPQDAHSLKEAYLFLRRLEHFIQYRQDAQTHLLPHDTDTLTLLAETLGFPSLEVFKQTLNAHRSFVNQRFHRVFHTDQEDNAEDHQLEALIQSSFEASQTQEISQRIKLFLEGSKIRRLSETSRNKVMQILPRIIQESKLTAEPKQACLLFLDLLEHIAQRSVYLSLFVEYPATITRIANMIAASPWAAQFLIQNPLLLDSVIDWSQLMQEIDFNSLKQQLSQHLKDAVLPDGRSDIEQQMNIMRDMQKQIRFQILAQDLGGKIQVETIADLLSATADMFLASALNCVWKDLRETKFPQAPENANFAIIAYGRLGGKELGYESDLDIVMIYDDKRPEALEQYTLLARRLTTWFTTMTPSGRLYDIDLRLRPDGDAGLLTISLDAFKNYQLNHAWLWEHQALSRARFVAGETALGEAFEDFRKEILSQVRDPQTLKKEIVEMRQKISDGHKNPTPLFDLKYDKGGMVDIEFMVQYLILSYAHQYPDLMKNLGNIALLKMCANYGFIPQALGLECANIYRTYRATQHKCRLQSQGLGRVPVEDVQTEREKVCQLWEAVFKQPR
ncbi:bifunctional [glutamate--ammonia ligase]-adenylyl-L-tyrosine phosphorylase/[glutamate--ammonia-ligase] adenylyltransferase [Basilea psittacipulmonis]|uniref:Bifunctional glutamine synthetase adenylyltransferase/adenylyl-removing enzyme n=1 Tax=Basilea psittacipulmonis DSM 24701 TaxID=1072685 RepID=A0A077DD26_9BURK|nr:bifunctional [glutamate--ammonia ligase]-adenylyl-L-tyrosine phosphorylase/[glutamate--ammonia-ligase] adenylyltransferase [Basilea psittacipulmonis]AIL32514.1 hypothetical protein IX83_03620 [Basilea psittacipulmonis DSM 24701]